MNRSYCVCSNGLTDTFKKQTDNYIFYWFNYLLRKTNLCGTVEERVADSGVINLELVDSVDVGNLKFSAEETVRVPLQESADKRIDANKFQLDVFGVERYPFILDKFLNLDSVYLLEYNNNNKG